MLKSSSTVLSGRFKFAIAQQTQQNRGGMRATTGKCAAHRANDNLQASMVQLRLEGSNVRPQACMTLA
jgi:hypothetical protein